MPTGPTNPSAPGGFTPPTIEELHALIPQYEISAVLGIGGMGAVYKGRQVKLARDVAIKILPADAAGSESDEAFNFAERFQREAQAMARLHHQRIIAVHDYGEATREDGKPILYIVMEFVQGTDLNHLIKSGSLAPDQALAVITQICDALHYAHEQGIVHRDIKPANVMLDVEGNVKIADFGLAKLTGGDAAAQSQLTMTNMAMGTPDYVSPEQLEQGREVDNRADIYSLGVMIYEMLTGAVPRGAFLPPSKKSTNPLDPRLDEVVNKAMQADPDTRYQQVSQLWTDVDKIRTTPPPAAGAAPMLVTGRVPVMAGGTGSVKILTGETGRVSTKSASTQLPIKEPMDPARKKKIITLSLVSIASLLLLGALAALVLAPSASKNQDLATATAPTTKPEPPKTTSSQDKGAAGESIASAIDTSLVNSGSRPGPNVPATPSPTPPPTTPNRTVAEPLANRQEGPTPDAAKAPDEGASGASRPGPSVPATPSTTSTPPPDATNTSTPEITGPMDLLAAIEFPRDVLNGSWSRVGSAVVRETSDSRQGALLALPVEAPDSYTLRASFTTINVSESTNLLLPVGDRHVELNLGGFAGSPGGPLSGLSNIDENSANTNATAVTGHALEKDRTYALEARVALNGNEAGIEIDLEGDELIRWTGPVASLSLSPAPFISKALTMGPLIFLRHPDTGARSAARWESAALIPGVIKPPPTLTTSESETGKKIAALTAEYTRKFNAALGDAHNEGIAALNTSYAGALERAEKSIAASGNLDALLLYRNEIEAAKTAGRAPIATPLPESAPSALATMRETYTTTVAQREQKRDADVAPLLRQFDQALDQLQRDLTREQKIEDALEVRKARDQLLEKGTSLFTGAAALTTAGPWIPLFNGKDLEGWNGGAQSGSFRIEPEEGILILQGPRADFYYIGDANGGTFKNFEFKTMVKTVEKANSGVFLHITPQTKGSAYEVQIANQNKDLQKTGSLWGVQPVERMHARDGDWFELHIKVEGKTITVAIDGKTVNEYTDPGNGPKRLGEGSIMLQWNGGDSPESAVHFKNVQVRPLD